MKFSFFRLRYTYLPGVMLAIIITVSCHGPNQPDDHNQWVNLGKGLWKMKAYDPPAFNLLSSTEPEAKMRAIEEMGPSEIPIDTNDIFIRKKHGKVYLRFPLEMEEQIYGLGLHFKTVAQRGRILRLHMDHYGDRDNGRTHAPVPFFISSKGYGVFINSARYIDAYVGTGVRKNSKVKAVVQDRNTDKSWKAMPYSDNLEFVIPGEGVELIMFTGNNMMEVVQKFNLYCGGGVIPPKWGLGFWHRTPTLYSANEVKSEAGMFEKKGFPLDVLGLEPGWHSKAYPNTFEWSEERFENPALFVKEMGEENIRLNLWCNPYLWPDSQIDQRMKPYTASHTVWNGTVADYSIPEARNIMKEFMKEHQLDLGVSGYKIDEVDGFDSWLFPDITEFPSGNDAESIRQVYGNYMMKLTDEMFRESNKRTYGLVRAANAGSVGYPYVIYNDYYSHEGFITALVNSGFNGVLWTPEVRSGGSSSDWVRRMQTVCFSPMAMINAWADGTKPWSFGEVYGHCKEVALLRMRLLPYIYSSFADYYFKGKPPFYALNLLSEFEGKNIEVKGVLDATKNPYAQGSIKEIKDQYMMGEFMMVAPLFNEQTERLVVLPKGNWYDFYTGELAGNNEVIKVEAALDKIPLFVKDGGIIPMIPAIRQTVEWGNSIPLELRVYGSGQGNFTLYDDDGETFDYEKGAYAQLEIQVKDYEGSYGQIPSKHWSYGDITWNFMSSEK